MVVGIEIILVKALVEHVLRIIDCRAQLLPRLCLVFFTAKSCRNLC